MRLQGYSPVADAVPDSTLAEWSTWLPVRRFDGPVQVSDAGYCQLKIDALLGLDLRREVHRARQEAKACGDTTGNILDTKAAQARFHDWRDLLSEYREALAIARRQRTLFGMYCRYPRAVGWQVEELANRLRDGLAETCATQETYCAAFVRYAEGRFDPGVPHKDNASRSDWHLLASTMDGMLFDHSLTAATRIAFIGTDEACTPKDSWETGNLVQYLASPDPELLTPGCFEPGPVSVESCREAIITALEREAAYFAEGRYEEITELENGALGVGFLM